METDTSTFLAALSSILTVVSVLYGLWFRDIEEIRELDSEAYLGGKRAKISGCFWAKLLPLFLISLVTALLFLPHCLALLAVSINLIRDGEAAFDPVKSAFLFLEALLLYLALRLIPGMCDITRLLRHAQKSP